MADDNNLISNILWSKCMLKWINLFEELELVPLETAAEDEWGDILSSRPIPKVRSFISKLDEAVFSSTMKMKEKINSNLNLKPILNY